MKIAVIMAWTGKISEKSREGKKENANLVESKMWVRKWRSYEEEEMVLAFDFRGIGCG